MSKKMSKAKETVILIRIPDAHARRGEVSLTIQRGDLGSMQQFAYTGLTLSGNIAQAIQAAFITLAKLEATPPPVFTSDTATTSTHISGSSETPEKNTELDEATDNADSTDTDDSLPPGEVSAEEPALPDEESDTVVTVPTSTPVGTATSTAATLPVNQSQLNLF